MRHGNEVNLGVWECCKIMGHVIWENLGTEEWSKIMGHGNEVNHGMWE